MGEVYKAHDTRLDRTVAIKVLPAHAADDPNWQARFEREARSVSGLSHPQICALYDVGHEDGLHFLVMEYLEGETLAARLDRGSLDLNEALAYAEQIAQALAAAHRAGVMHRDLKPGNVMLTRSGAKLLDFGLAKPFHTAADGTRFTMAPTATSPLTATGTVIGTFQYMAPEMLEGGEADARSDTFAFGAVLYEMVTGRRAFEGKTQASVVASILKEEARSLCPPALDRLVQRCLAKDPDERWQSASDLAKELSWILSGEAPAATTGQAAVATPRGSARLAWSAAGVLAIVAVVLAVLALRQPVAVPVGAIRPAGGGDPQPVTELSESPVESSHRYPHFLPDGRHFIYLALTEAGASGTGIESEHRVMLGSLDGGAPQLLMQGASNTVYANGLLVFRRGQALRARPFDAERLEFTGDAVTIVDAVHYDAAYERAIFSASDNLLAYVAGAFSGEAQLRVLDRSGNLVRTIGETEAQYQTRFSPDGRRLATRVTGTQGEAVWIIDLEREVRTRLTFDPGFQGSPVWSPDGKRVAYGWNTGAGWGTAIRPADGAGEPQIVVEAGSDAYPVEWSRDGKYLLLATFTVDAEYDILILDLEGGTEPRTLLQTPHNETLPAISPDGRWMAYTSDESGRMEVYVTRFPSLEGKWLVSGSGGLEPVWNVDGTSLFFRSANHGVMEVPLTISGASIQIGSARRLFDVFSTLDIDEHALDLSPDGELFVANSISEEQMRSPITVVVDWAADLPDAR
jgi:hypothetical protein